MQIHVTEHKSNGTLNPLQGRLVRVFVDRDYRYGYFVDEHALFGMLSQDQQQQYLATADVKLDVSVETAQRVIDIGVSPFPKPRLVA